MLTSKGVIGSLLAVATTCLVGCGKPAPSPVVEESSAPAVAAKVVSFSPGPDVQLELQEELILVEPGTEILLEEGVYELDAGLSLDVDNVSIRGQGMDKTILRFANQEEGAEGLYITSNGVTIEDLAIEDTKGNGLKSQTANNITLRRVRVEWTGGPKETNGAYGIYPVSSENVLIEGCVAIGGSDSGIYVGQSRNIIVRDCVAKYNVAGIEIENCYDADVYRNEATKNTGGILVFDLPNLPQQGGHNVRLFENQVYDNSTDNFAPEGNIVGTVPTGTGVMIVSNSNVEVFDNEIKDHGTANLLVLSYLSTGRNIKDPKYYAFPEAVHIHHNRFGVCGSNPKGDAGGLIAMILGTPLPDIIWDGVVNPEKLVDGKLPDEFGLFIHDNEKADGDLGFGNLGGLASLSDPSKAQPLRDLSAHLGELPPVTAVVIEGVDP